jgi:uncharacterized protein (TIGR03663 family)
MEITTQPPTTTGTTGPTDTTDTTGGTPPAAYENRASYASYGAPRVLVSLELVIYVALLVLSLTLRLVELGTIPLNDREAYEALAAFRTIQPRAAGPRLIAHDPLMFTADALTMSIVGADTSSARLPTALLGVLLVAAPLLFRRWLGRASALLIAGLFAISPVLLAASRSMSGAVWSAALAVAGIYFVGRFLEMRRVTYAVAASTVLLMLVLAAEPAGFLTFLGMVVGIVFAQTTLDDDDHRYRSAVFETLRTWPWIPSVIVGGAATGLVAMVFVLYPEGLSGIGDVLYQALRGFAVRPAGYPFAYPLLTSLLYEPVLWVFGLTGVTIVLRRDSDAPGVFIQRALVGWLIASIAWSLVFAGAGPDHALWLTLPLAGLAAITIERVLSPVRDSFWKVPTWGPWIHGLAVAATLAIAAINLLIVGRLIMNTLPDLMPRLERPMQLLMIFPALLLVAITFFLVGSMWGARAAWRGTGIGLLFFLGIYSLGMGWRAAVLDADDPRELFQAHPAARNLSLMNATLETASRRSTGAPYDMDIVVQTAPDGPTDDGALAWALRYFSHTTFVDDLSPTTNTPVVITPKANDKPVLGAAYVGQSFPVSYTWDRRNLGWDFLTWLYERDTRTTPEGNDRVIAWVRADVYGVMSDSGAPPGAPSPQ